MLSVWKATDHSFVCSEHFTDDSFEINSALTWPEEKKALKPENVPTIFHQSPQTDHEIGHKRRAEGSGIGRRRGVVEKRQRHEVKVLSILAFCKLNQYRLSIKLLLDPHTFQLASAEVEPDDEPIVLNTTMYQCKPVFKLAKEMCVLKYCQKQALRVKANHPLLDLN